MSKIIKTILAYIITTLIAITIFIPQITTYIHEYGHYVIGNYILWAKWTIVINATSATLSATNVVSNIIAGDFASLTKSKVDWQYISWIHFIFPLTTKEKLLWILFFSMGMVFENIFRILLILLCFLSIKLIWEWWKNKKLLSVYEINHFMITYFILFSVYMSWINLYPSQVDEKFINDWQQIVNLFTD
jgi:hypothetical protein